MIESIGNLHRGIPALARRAAGIVTAEGECAVFLSFDSRRAYAMTRDDPEWRRATSRNRAYLVGVYVPGPTVYQLAQWIEADMRALEDEEMAA